MARAQEPEVPGPVEPPPSPAVEVPEPVEPSGAEPVEPSGAEPVEPPDPDPEASAFAPPTLAASATETPQPPAPKLALEVMGGHDAPLGTGALLASYAFTPRLALGAGVGLSDERPGGVHVHYGLFGRLRLRDFGPFSLGAVVALSRGGQQRERTYTRPGYTEDRLRWYWSAAYRADVGLAAEGRLGRFTARLEAGVGLVLNRAETCGYQNLLVYVDGACYDPQIPPYYRFELEPGRVVPYVAFSIRHAVGGDPGRTEGGAATIAEASAVRGPPGAGDPRADSVWISPTALTAPAGTVTATVYELMGLGLTVGITDVVQAAAGVGLFVPERGPVFGMASLKVRALDRGRFHLAAFAGSFGWFGEHYSAVFAGVGPVASLCLDEACRSVFSSAVLAGAAFWDPDEGASHRDYGLVLSPSVVIAVARHLKLMMEAYSVPGAWAAGVRIPYGPVAIDLGVLMGELPIGTLSWRW